MRFPRSALRFCPSRGTAAMVQEKNPSMPRSGSGCDSRSPLSCGGGLRPPSPLRGEPPPASATDVLRTSRGHLFELGVLFSTLDFDSGHPAVIFGRGRVSYARPRRFDSVHSDRALVRMKKDRARKKNARLIDRASPSTCEARRFPKAGGASIHSDRALVRMKKDRARRKRIRVQQSLPLDVRSMSASAAGGGSVHSDRALVRRKKDRARRKRTLHRQGLPLDVRSTSASAAGGGSPRSGEGDRRSPSPRSGEGDRRSHKTSGGRLAGSAGEGDRRSPQERTNRSLPKARIRGFDPRGGGSSPSSGTK